MRVDRYDELVAARLGINRTDLRRLDLLHQGDTMTAGQLAAGSGLTSGATTRMIDWLEQAGYIRPLPDRDDRRRVLVELTPRARDQRAGAIVHSEEALAPDLAHDFYAAVKSPKHDLWLDSQGQIDFYDDPKLVTPAADAIAAFLR
jgi:DNA-binding MarR family transcriptional regulator